jgi:hypothetical protein
MNDLHLTLYKAKTSNAAIFRSSNGGNGSQPLDHGGFGAVIRAIMPASIEPLDDDAEEYLATEYRDWLNNYLTLERFAGDRCITEFTAVAIIEAGKIAHGKGVKA